MIPFQKHSVECTNAILFTITSCTKQTLHQKISIAAEKNEEVKPGI